MADTILLLAELISGAIIYVVYGTKARPRHPIWRIFLLVLVFGGGALMSISVVLGSAAVPRGWLTAWGLLCIVMVHGEHNVEHNRMALAVIAYTVVILVLLFSHDVSAA